MNQNEMVFDDKPRTEEPFDSALKTEGNPLEKELNLQKDKYLRLAADFDNFRKKVSAEAGRKATVQRDELIHDLLPVVDNLERALAVGPDTSLDQVFSGVAMTLKQFRNLLGKHEIILEPSLGLPFDPMRHEAIASRNDPSQPNHTILETAQPGYGRGRAIFRAAKVVVNDHSL